MIHTHNGDLTGVPLAGATGYLGIRYAEPPVGERRWRPPTPVAAWEGVREATSFGPSAPQLEGPFSGLVPGMTVGDTSEDCLTLNVWSPDDAVDLPVMVWLHGGAFQIGGSSLATYDGLLLATEQRVVVVSVNYRLGALGWLTGAAGVTPNCGQLDQVLALEWVRDNIAVFGGDPHCVTVFGESAGAGSVIHLATLGTGLFHRLIAQSPGAGQTLPPEIAQQVADAMMSRISLDSPVDDILAAQAEVAAELLPVVGSMPFHPSGEPVFGRTGNLPLLAGSTAHEMRLFVPAMELDAATLTMLLEPLLSAEAHRALGSAAVAAVVDAYAGPTAMGDIATDVTMRLPLGDLVDSHEGPVFAYSFAWESVGFGACHAVDLPFTFGTFDREGWADWVGGSPQELSRAMREAWAAFARDGVPAAKGLPTWPEHDESRLTMLLGRTVEIVEDPLSQARRRCAPVRGAAT
ncbi:MAG: carboxylesterase/lipase family protein [Frankiales bacterium]|nr:carboxylesterase/lipase family protein [Frankiales bacterium]